MKIESNIPLPPGRRSRYPLQELGVGQSFLVQGEPHRKPYKSIRYANKHGKFGQFICAKVEGGTRVWRLQ